MAGVTSVTAEEARTDGGADPTSTKGCETAPRPELLHEQPTQVNYWYAVWK